MNLINKKNIIGICIILLISLISIFGLLPINKNYEPVCWMKNVSDDIYITEMTIPGTHDSGATHSLFDVAGKCQDLNIREQLNVGVRFLDIRLQLVNDELNIVHSFVDQDLKFDEVLKDIDEFLSKHESEFIIISLKEDANPKNSKIDFDGKLIEDLKEYSKIQFCDLPKTLGEARGKIYILNRFTNNDLGINAYSGWLDSTTFEINNLYIQDNYCINDIDTKINDINNTIIYSNNNKDRLVINFTSCYLDNAFPPTYAGTSAKSINGWLLNNLDDDSHLGIIVIDFITEEISRKVYERNIK